ncbi:hypothetical protein ACFLT7_05985 [candidate division KSB1 bacterium]
MKRPKLLILIVAVVAAVAVKTFLMDNADRASNLDRVHCQLLQSDELQMIVGDASRDGVGGTQYCGVWSLTSKHRVFNAFGNSYAGLIPGPIRSKAPTLEYIDDRTCALIREADKDYPTDVRAEYTVADPYYIDHKLTLTDREDARGRGCDFREVSWCCYMNSPEDSNINFISDGNWFSYISPEHGVGSNIAPSYIPDSALEVWPQVEGRRPFHWDRVEKRFDQPFYYGRLGNMVLILIFDNPDQLRFYCSPSGGGGSLLPGKSCPAWDFEWIIPDSDYQVGREYSFRMRLVYKRFVDEDDVLNEVRKAQTELGFQTVGDGVGGGEL